MVVQHASESYVASRVQPLVFVPYPSGWELQQQEAWPIGFQNGWWPATAGVTYILTNTRHNPSWSPTTHGLQADTCLLCAEAPSKNCSKDALCKLAWQNKLSMPIAQNDRGLLQQPLTHRHTKTIRETLG